METKLERADESGSRRDKKRQIQRYCRKRKGEGKWANESGHLQSVKKGKKEREVKRDCMMQVKKTKKEPKRV